jgi:hypothetical protein
MRRRTRTVRWQPVEGVGLEHLTLTMSSRKIVVRSVVVGEREGAPYGVRYEIICDGHWVTQSLDLETTDGRSLHLGKDKAGRWHDGRGRHLRRFDGCVDVDLSGSPFTNTLAINRLRLRPNDGPTKVRVFYVPFETFRPFPDEQLYTCLKPKRLYRFEEADGSFRANISVDRDGLVTNYPGLFKRRGGSRQ